MSKEDAIVATVLGYFEGWFDGDESRMAAALHPVLAKRALGDDGETLDEATTRSMVDATARGVGKGRYDATGIECQTTCPVSTAQFPTYEDNSIGGATYVDLNTTFKFDAMGDGDGEFFVNVTNLFDSDPILLPETGLAANTTYSDLLGRSFRVGVRLKLR